MDSQGWILGMSCLQMDFVGIGTRLHLISFLGFMALTDLVKCSVRTGWSHDACDVWMDDRGCVR